MARGPAPSAPRPAPARCRTGPVAVRGKPANRVHGLRFLDTKGGTHTAFPGRWGPSRRASLMLCTPLAALLSQALSLGASERRPHSGERHPLFNKLASGSPLGLCVEFSLSSLARSLARCQRTLAPLLAPVPPRPPRGGAAPPRPRSQPGPAWPGSPGSARASHHQVPAHSSGCRSRRFSDCFQAESQASGSRGRGCPGGRGDRGHGPGCCHSPALTTQGLGARSGA